MYKYAQIDLDTGVCVAVSILSGEVIADHMIPLTETDDVEPRDIYDKETKTWTKAEPLPPEHPVPSKIELLEAEIANLNAQNIELWEILITKGVV
ncbi:hypothetical protein [Paenibacillus naphthalenovorans]|uniref:hypothetical protein n=1 Tax=Paenibacillus naphthalenovorans TaxID=162209 RepID=UPI003D2AE7B2